MIDSNDLRQPSVNKFSGMISVIGLIWLISVVSFTGVLDNFIPKLLPRDISGLPGILSMPFLHSGFSHLLANTFPLIVFSILISLNGKKYYLTVTLLIVLLSGVMLWVMGRSSYHVGASGLIFGYFGFLLMRMYYSPSVGTIIISIGVLIAYGGIVWGVIPQGNHISWEGHLFGLIAGGVVAKIMGSGAQIKQL